jgi:ABC-2 type transport system permease protein
MDRLIALLILRVRLGLRAMLGRGEGPVGLVLLLSWLAFSSLVLSALVFFGVRALERGNPQLLIPVVSAGASLLGLFWALSPLLTGLALAETHDLTRLLLFPLSFRTLVASTLLANFMEPTVLAKLPVLLGFTAAVSGSVLEVPPIALGALMTFAFTLATAQTVGLALHALSRNRRFHDRALLLGVGLGFALSLLPLLFLGGGQGTRRFLRAAVGSDVLALSPFAWGVRAAVHASRGEASLYVFWLGAATLATALAFVSNVMIARRLYEGEVILSGGAGRTEARARFVLPGAMGALLEKDLRLIWREPRLKASLFTGILGPILLLLLWRGASGRLPPGGLLFLAAFSGLGTVGGNAFALERRGLLLLFAFPVDRFELLLAKNLAAFALRLPSLVALGLAAAFLAPPGFLVPLLAIGVATTLLMTAGDNYMSILFPLPVPLPGQNPYGPASGGRGLLAAAIGGGLMLAALALAAPFVFLIALPAWLERRQLFWLTVPLALAGAVATYALLTGGAAHLLQKRESDLLSRVLAEE